MPWWEITFLGFASLLAGIISGVSGMGGGIFLFSLMTFTSPLSVIIPVHGVVQFSSNLARIFLLKENIKIKFVLYFTLGLPFGVFLAIRLLKEFSSPDFLLLIIALMIFLSVFKPKRLPLPVPTGAGFIGVGFFSGLLGILIGTVGPFIALFFIRDDLSKEEIVATKAVTQFLVHLSKIPTYVYLGFAFKEYTYLIIAMVGCSVIGTQFGVKILRRISQDTFKTIFKAALLVSAFRLLYKGSTSIF